jgi:hypothetical protein
MCVCTPSPILDNSCVVQNNPQKQCVLTVCTLVMFSRILMLSNHKISIVKLLTSFYWFVFCTYVNCFGLLCLQYLNTISSTVCYSVKPTFIKQRLTHSSSCKSIWYMPTLKVVIKIWYCSSIIIAVNSWDSSGKGLFWGTVLAVVPEETEQNYKKCTTDKHKWPAENSSIHIVCCWRKAILWHSQCRYGNSKTVEADIRCFHSLAPRILHILYEPF